jgi:hypothetical protein
MKTVPPSRALAAKAKPKIAHDKRSVAQILLTSGRTVLSPAGADCDQ